MRETLKTGTLFACLKMIPSYLMMICKPCPMIVREWLDERSVESCVNHRTIEKFFLAKEVRIRTGRSGFHDEN
jgi:hypothetical protein